MRRTIFKYLFLAHFGGSLYVTLEVFFRGYSHWTMYLVAALLFIVIGLLNEARNSNFILQCFIGSALATLIEFFAGCVLNIMLDLHLWDYSNQWGNVLGQICPLFSALWVLLSGVAIVLDDTIRWKFFQEDKPSYYIK